MLDRQAEQSYRQGLTLLEQRKHREALVYFKGAIDLDRRRRGGNPEARYLSCYGLTLGLTRTSLQEALLRCREAAVLEPYRPESWLHLARVALMARRRAEAYRALQRGLNIEPGHRGILAELRRMGVRRRPFLPFLSRANPLNVVLGQVAGSVTR